MEDEEHCAERVGVIDVVPWCNGMSVFLCRARLWGGEYFVSDGVEAGLGWLG